jgi:pyruvate/2-oxoglutarate dehydrogenase complex dihydrolipoamide dehydrogenase (E3) component/uncharacterized membrane protein YdjX (TVP38/TMEM64 family)
MRKIIFVSVIAAIAAFFLLDLDSYFTLASFQAQQSALANYVSLHPVQAASLYFLCYVSVAALSLPGATLITLLGGAMFGVVWGSILVSFASTIGATLAFLFSRYFFRGAVQQRFANKFESINEGIEKEGAMYLFSLRLIPLVPYFMVNLLMGLTKIKIWIFAAVSQLGMLPATIVYVNAGTQLAKLDSLSGILSPKLILSFAAIGILPLVTKKLVERYRAHAALRHYEKPKRFDRNLVVIGAGSGGLVSSYIAAAIEAKVTLIEKAAMGGDCLNFGCVPSKTLIRSAKAAQMARTAGQYGVSFAQVNVDFKAVMQRIHAVIAKIAPHDSVERYTELGVECIEGEAEIIDPYHVRVGDQQLSTRNIILATGGSPIIPQINGIQNIDFLTSDSIWDIEELPQKLVIVGGGPIGCELSQAFGRLGSSVTLIQRGARIMPREDLDVSEIIHAQFELEGITIHCGADAASIQKTERGNELVCQRNSADSESFTVEFDQILFAIGRKARTSTKGINELGIELRANGTIKTDPYLRTSFPNIYACGDATGPYQFTHVAAHQAWYATVNALFSGFKKFEVDYSVIPWTTFTDPEVARVGLNEEEANKKNIPFEITKYGLDDLDRAITDGVDHGFVKVLTVPGKDRILGVTIVGEHAGDLLAEFVLAMRYKLGLNKILGTIHTYPTLAEANKYAAGVWRRAHKPQLAMKFLNAFHRWRRK